MRVAKAFVDCHVDRGAYVDTDRYLDKGRCTYRDISIGINMDRLVDK